MLGCNVGSEESTIENKKHVFGYNIAAAGRFAVYLNMLCT